MKMLRPAITLSVVLVSLSLALPVRQTTAATAPGLQSTEPVILYGTTSPVQPAASTSAVSPEAAAQADTNALTVNRPIPRLAPGSGAPTVVLPAPASTAVGDTSAAATGFNGI